MSVKHFMGTPYTFCRNQGACFWKYCTSVEGASDGLGVFLAVPGGSPFSILNFAKGIHSCLGEEWGGGMLEAELPSFLVPFLAYFYYNLASHEVFPEEENVLTMPKQAFSSTWRLCFSFWSHLGLPTK